MGHLGVALGAKGCKPGLPLWLLLCAALTQDLLDVATGFAGIAGETAYLLSHSPLSALPLAALVGGIYWAAARDRMGAALLAGLVASHAVLDLLTSRLPTWPGGPSVGLHLYRHDPVDFSMEIALLAGGWLAYRRTLPEARRSSPAAWMVALVPAAFQIVFQLLPIT